MSFLDALRHRLRTALRSDEADRERAEEYALHQSLAQDQRAHDGASLDEARFAARREFGNGLVAIAFAERESGDGGNWDLGIGGVWSLRFR